MSGPFELDVVQRLAAAGEVGPSDLVRVQGARDWLRAADVDALAPSFLARAAIVSEFARGKTMRATTLPPPSEFAKIPQSGDLVDGKYRIGAQLGQGAMGEILSAKNVHTLKRVALKWLRPELAANPVVRQRFLNEARLAARISHPNVIDIYDVVEEGGPYLVMEQLDGEPLSSLLARGALSRTERLRVLLLAMDGVAAAHKQSVVHRDLKPENIFVCTDSAGRTVAPKVLDFGISKAVSERDDAALTQIGVLLGTPHYAPPEQLSHAKYVDHRADVYALGVILYQCLCGKLPYDHQDLLPLLAAITMGGAVSPRAHDPSIPEGLAAIVLKAIGKHPNDRYASVEALQLALMPFAEDRTHASPPPRQPAVVSRALPTLMEGSPAQETYAEQTTVYRKPPAQAPRRSASAARIGIALGMSALGVAAWFAVHSLHGSQDEGRPSGPIAAPVPGVITAVAPSVVMPSPLPAPAAPRPEPQAATQAATQAPQLAPQTTADQASAALAGLRSGARRCGDGTLGVAKVELRLDRDGRLIELRAPGTPPAITACLVRVAQRLKFASPSAEPRVLAVSLSLLASRAAPPQADALPTARAEAPPAPEPSAAAAVATEAINNPYR